MSIERTMFAFGGTMVMLTSLLALFHNPNWTWLTLFIGFNCLQSSFTGFCPPSWLMKKFGMKSEAELALGEQPWNSRAASLYWQYSIILK